jgi:predicted MFS family arabinose efflux permease
MPGRAVLLLSLAAFASAAALRAADPLLPLIAGSFDTTPGNAAAVITGFALAYGLLQLVTGPIADRIGKYRMVCWVTAISAAGNLLCALAPSLPLLTAARFATGATVGAIVPLAMAWIGDVVPYAQRQLVLARFLVGHMLGVAFATAASGFLGQHLGWRPVFGLLAALYAAVALMLFLELRGNPLTREKAGAAVSLGAAFRRMAGLVRRPWVRVMLLTVFLEGGLFYGSLAFVALAAAPAAGWAVPCVLALGTGIYMMHNTLQVNATQMAPEARGGALALFACSLFTGQSAGVWVGSRVVDAAGAQPMYAAAALGLGLLALAFRHALSRRAGQRPTRQ